MTKEQVIKVIEENITISGEVEKIVFEVLEQELKKFNTLEEMKNFMITIRFGENCLEALIDKDYIVSFFEAYYIEILEYTEKQREEYGEIDFTLSHINLVINMFYNIIYNWGKQIEDLTEPKKIYCDIVVKAEWARINILNSGEHINLVDTKQICYDMIMGYSLLECITRAKALFTGFDSNKNFEITDVEVIKTSRYD